MITSSEFGCSARQFSGGCAFEINSLKESDIVRRKNGQRNQIEWRKFNGFLGFEKRQLKSLSNFHSFSSSCASKEGENLPFGVAQFTINIDAIII
jgi:hypothetical protein